MIEAIRELVLAIVMLSAFLFVIPVLMNKALYVFAKITYKRAHKTSQTVQNLNSYKQLDTVLFDIDSKNKTLQEVQAERNQMKKLLGGI